MDLNQLQHHFFLKYGQNDHIPRIFFAPGRVNLIGEHTDYNGGFVFPCAIQYGTSLVIRKTNDNIIRLASVNDDYYAEISPASIISHNKQWVNYPLGVINEFVKMKIQIPGFELLFSGNIPKGSGLSSSASIEMVTAFAVSSLLNLPLEIIELAKLAQRAENHFVGVSCGIMDQFAVGLGIKNQALFLNCQTLEYKSVPVHLKEFGLIIGDTNKPRELAGSKYNERVAECQLAVSYLSREVSLSRLSEISFMHFFKIQDRIPDELIRRRARHVISENQRVLNAVSVLLKGDIVQFGALMNASHESLKENYEVTGFELDTLVDEAQKVSGVLGARMTGAGFGGCTVNLVRRDCFDEFIAKTGENYHKKTGLTAGFYIAEIADGVREIF